ncbi:metallophosphoesterase [uncultured Imperialibacter sp.]|uniref:metallophosphoesterase n=1 Tax=uncultured Imperialibacter sp. TaxID=1672639 RepID=UPI0030D9B86D|tara:strand:- start:20902 stop:22149 length:1248 start_codon:yes stop_codon:yes gene_type:complete
MNRIVFAFFLLLLLLAIDWYIFQAVRLATADVSLTTRKIVYWIFWGVTTLSVFGILVVNFADLSAVKGLRTFIVLGIFINVMSKLFALIFLLVGDIIRGFQWLGNFIFSSPEPINPNGRAIPRSEFISKVALIAGAVPALTMSYGILSGAHDYRIRRKTIFFPNLPKEFDGIQIGQLSDIHSGSFFNKTAVKGGVEMLLGEKPDIIFFTGDLVNNEAEEVKEYISIFDKVKAPLGVYSTLGNHDYGDYKNWASEAAKQANLEDLKAAHKELGWRLMMNENLPVKVDGEQIGILGIENWGAGRFAKYGKMDLAHQGTEEYPFKILLSHDPSHWDAQVRPNYGDVELMLSGHTHGFQFGVEIGGFKWSPSQYVYKQWAGLYQEENQYLYVNRGFGYLGYPGRIGILPEITILELKRA